MGTLGMEICPDAPSQCEEGVRVAVTRPGGWITIGHAPVTPAVAARPFDLETDVPAIMIANHWTTGAAFQKKWFAGAPIAMDTSLRLRDTRLAVDTTSVTMKWVCGFPRAKSVRDAIFSGKAWLTDNTRKEWLSRLDKEFSRPGNGAATQVAFGNLKATGRAAYEQHITFALMEQITEPGGKPDDLLAALGRFTFFVLPEGTAERTAGGYRVRLAKVGVMVGDYFDFDGFQPLGWWGLPDKLEMPTDAEARAAAVRMGWAFNQRPGLTWVENRTYREFRAAHKKGGDFLVFSDVEVTAVNETFAITRQ